MGSSGLSYIPECPVPREIANSFSGPASASLLLRSRTRFLYDAYPSTPPVLIHMLEAIRRIGEQASSDEQRRSLADHARLILDTGLEKEPAGPGRRALEAASSEALGAIGTIRDLHTSLPDGLRAGS